MPRTVADALTEVRYLLLDQRVPQRFPDATLQSFVQQGVEVAFRLRPDMMVGTGVWAPPASLALSDTLPTILSTQYFTALCAYAAGLAESQDDQYTADGRVAFFLSRFQTSLTAMGV